MFALQSPKPQETFAALRGSALIDVRGSSTSDTYDRLIARESTCTIVLASGLSVYHVTDVRVQASEEQNIALVPQQICSENGEIRVILYPWPIAYVFTAMLSTTRSSKSCIDVTSDLYAALHLIDMHIIFALAAATT